ncbi:MAG: hypothetical protein IBJ03_00335 [Gemmatimonadaceae bacterium]|nr:hypothetical protein [Gemmatimonadaceae bacterium]
MIRWGRRLAHAVLAASAPLCVACECARAQNVRTQNSRAGVDDGKRQPPVASRGRLAVTGCSGQPISDIVIITQPPFTERLPQDLEWVRRTVRRLHVNTHDEVIRQFLLLKPGDACNQIQRAESERILRAQPYLVDARIHVYDDERGGVRLDVETRDDFSLIFEPLIRTSLPFVRGMRLGETNLGGSATMAALEWRDGVNYNDVLGVQFTDYQFGGGRNELRVEGRRNLFGQRMNLEVLRPYYTDLQRFAWLGSVGGTREPMRFQRESFPANAVTVRREYGNIGGLVRVGPVGRLKLLGASITRETHRTDEGAVLLTPEGVKPDTFPAAPPLFDSQNVLRANLLLGMRAIRFKQVQGFDALTGAQDVRVGVQAGFVVGHSLATSAAIDRDRFFASNVYAGAAGDRWYVGLQGITEARYHVDRARWENVIGSGRAAWYFRPAVRQTTVMQAEWATGRRMQVPFQLSLADREGGIMGHRNSWSAGARRMVLRAEQRLVVPTRFNVADIGLAGFAEAGRLWRESSVPYSVDAPWRGAFGVSLLAAVPPRSRRLWRVDFAVPVSNDPLKRFEIRFTGLDRSRNFWRDPQDVAASRERTAPTSIFTWP